MLPDRHRSGRIKELSMEQQSQTLAQQFIDALHALEQGSENDLNGLVALFSEGAHLTNAVLELAGHERTGRQGAHRFWAEYKSTLGQAFSTFHHVTTGNSAAGLFWTTEGHAPDGQPVKYHGATLLEFDESGKIKFFRGYYDTRELIVQPHAASA
jgi:ketosteroid isomerase-like protein